MQRSRGAEPSQQTPRRYFWERPRASNNRFHRKSVRPSLKARIAIVYIYTLPLAFSLSIILPILLDQGNPTKIHPLKRHLQDRKKEDLREVFYEADDAYVSSRRGVPKAERELYQSLVFKDEIRILVLHPGEVNDDISFHMEIAALGSNDNKYEALSYAWGNSTATHLIYGFDGTCVPVTESLHSALRRLRHQDRYRSLWIDALCIDQSDVDERSQQVRLMGDIFAKAERVVIWLGEACAQSNQAFASLEDLGSLSWQSVFWQVTWFKERGSRLLSKSFVRRTYSEILFGTFHQPLFWDAREEPEFDMTRIDWFSIHALLRRSWFHRLWVVQEVSHARRAVVLCGDQEFSWTVLAAALICLIDNGLTKYFSNPITALACTNVASIEYMRKRETKDPLFTVILDNAYGGCTDPRDKIFAMMSMAAGRDEFDWETSLDYSLSADELYKRFAIWDIVRNTDLRSLSCATSAPQHHTLLPSLPSWVPDWTRILDRNLLVRVNETSTFSAGLSKPYIVWFSHNNSLLHVQGAVVDSIHTLASMPHTLKATSLFEINEATVERFEGMRDWLSQCWAIARADRPMNPAVYEAFWRTMLCDLDREGNQAPKLYSRYFLAYFRFISQAPEILRATLQDPAAIEPLEPTMSGKLTARAVFVGLLPTVPTRKAWQFHEWFDLHLQTNTLIEDSLQKWGTRKSFCRTRDGRLARVPINAIETDLICVLHGSSVPYVLRLQEDGTYVVIGECYVHGVMHGEALQLPSYEPQILRLR